MAILQLFSILLNECNINRIVYPVRYMWTPSIIVQSHYTKNVSVSSRVVPRLSKQKLDNGIDGNYWGRLYISTGTDRKSFAWSIVI